MCCPRLSKRRWSSWRIVDDWIIIVCMNDVMLIFHYANKYEGCFYCRYSCNRYFCFTRSLFRLRNARISSLVPCRNVGLLLDAETREVIVIDGFRVVSVRKRSSKKSQRDCAHSLGKCLPEIQWRLEWRRFLDGCPRKRWFPVVIASKRYSRTLLDLRPPEVCA